MKAALTITVLDMFIVNTSQHQPLCRFIHPRESHPTRIGNARMKRINIPDLQVFNWRLL